MLNGSIFSHAHHAEVEVDQVCVHLTGSVHAAGTLAFDYPTIRELTDFLTLASTAPPTSSFIAEPIIHSHPNPTTTPSSDSPVSAFTTASPSATVSAAEVGLSARRLRLRSAVLETAQQLLGEEVNATAPLMDAGDADPGMYWFPKA